MFIVLGSVLSETVATDPALKTLTLAPSILSCDDPQHRGVDTAFNSSDT